MSTLGFSHYQHRQLPALLLATTITIGGTMPLFNPERAILTFGLPQRIASTRETWPVMTSGSARVTAMGLGIWGMYLAGHTKAIDVFMSSFIYIGLVDGWVCYQEGVTNKAIFRLLSSATVSLLGFFKVTGGD
ncbi:hypothetical protein KVT40_001692 [Elsinoe batatas]|uniref:Uncharacterized protein n=1 Tax=Elsinoe batatas TaxID=2601811 RepID=A0A8K0PK00_9PEZI|nr:hypothetical protein KVT40_001692 [Elsinoe batatas]